MLSSVRAASLYGCAAAQATQLEGTSWVLELPDGQATSGLLPVEVTLIFVSSESIEGTYGLQKYAGGYAVDGDTIAFQTLCWTTMACMAAGGTLNAEQEYLFALEAAVRYTIDRDTLTLYATDDRVLTFARR